MGILITGGDGFIGSHLAECLLGLGREVMLFDIKFGGNTEALDCPKIKGDVCDEQSFGKIPGRPDIIFHASAVSRVEWGEAEPERCLRVNVIGLLNTIRWAINGEPNPHIILASSREVYGEPTTLPATEDHPRRPISVYGISKLAAEELLVHHARAYGLRYTITRFSNVYGSVKDLPQRVIPRFVSFALSGQPLTVYGGEQVLDFTYIQDVIDALARTIKLVEDREESITGSSIHLTTGRGCAVKDLAHLVKSITKSSSDILLTERRSFDVRKFIGDYSRANRLLGYNPRVGLEEGLTRYVKECLQHPHPS